MSLHRWDEAEELFARGVGGSLSDREILLHNVDHELARAVRSLWQNSDEAGRFLDDPLLNLAAQRDSRRVGESVGGRFRILEFIGAGGMGEVYRAKDERLGRVVALKFLSLELTHRPEWRHRLENEARAVCSLTHPNICTLFDLGWDAGTPFLVMEYLQGPTLVERISNGRLPLGEMLAIASQVCAALRHAHLHGIVHRDLKPGNILLTDVGAKLVDFGIAKHSHRMSGATTTVTLTGDGGIVGSASYMSPEQTEGRTVDHRTDIFTFGSVLYEMATARRAFLGSSALATMNAVLTEEPVSARDLRPDLPIDLDLLVAKCLRKSPAERFQTMDDLSASLECIPVVSPEVAKTVGHAKRQNSIGRRALLVTAFGGTVAAAAVVATRFPSIWSDRRDSLAVLPFANGSNDFEVEYLADGISESLTNTLSRMQAVRVVARATASTFKGKPIEIGNIGRLLKVRTILTGDVTRDRDRINVRAALFDTATENAVWSKDYHGGLLDVLSMQEDVVRQVQRRLATRGEDQTKPSTHNAEAYQLYLRGRFAFARSTVADIQDGIGYFQKALKIDPEYALAYSGLADCYWGLAGNFLAPKAVMPKARAAASRAIELDPNLADGYLSMGVVHGWYDFDWKRSAEYLRRAIALNPNAAAARFWHGWNLVMNGHFDQGIAQANLAHERDPLSAFMETGVAQMHYYSGDVATGVKKLRAVVDAAPDFPPGHLYLGTAYVGAKRYDDAVRELELAYALDNIPALTLAYLAYAHAKLQDKDLALKHVARLTDVAKTRYVSPYLFAIVAAGLGPYDDVLRWLWKAYDERDDLVTVLKVDPIFEGFRRDSGYTALVDRLGFDALTPAAGMSGKA